LGLISLLPLDKRVQYFALRHALFLPITFHLA